MTSTVATWTLAVALLGGADTQETRWLTDYGEARQQAAQQHQPILIVFENSTSEAQATPALAGGEHEELLDRYVCLRLDVSTEYGRRIARSFEVEAVPYVVVSDNTPRYQLLRHAGTLSPGEWSSLLAAYRSGTRPRAAQPVTLQSGVSSAPAAAASGYRSVPAFCFT